MGIRLRIKHARGTDAVNVLPRGPGKPLIIGRGDECDVVLPSARVASKQVALFIHGGRWMAQDVGEPPSVLLNGETLAKALPINPGDRLSFTREIPPMTVQVVAIDPDATARFKTPGSSAPRPASARAAAAVGATDVSDDLRQAVSSAERTPRHRESPWQARSIGLAAVLLLFGLPVVIFWKQLKPFINGQRQIVVSMNNPTAETVQASPDEVEPPPVMEQVPSGQQPKATLFQDRKVPRPTPSPAPTPKPNPVPAPLPMPTQTPAEPAPEADDIEPPPADAFEEDPARQEPDWRSVIDAATFSPPAERIYFFMQYRDLHPQSTLLGELDKMQLAALDELYWIRVHELTLEKEQAEGDRKGDIEQEVEHVLGFTGTPPASGDESAVAAAREQRNDAIYRKWCDLALSRIRRMRGALQW